LDWSTAQRILLLVSASLYFVSLLALTFSKPRSTFVELSVFRRLLSLGVISHVCFALFRAWYVGRLPFLDRTELLSWFALSCVVLCLVGADWLRSRVVIGGGVLGASLVTAALGVWYDPLALPGMDVVQGALSAWYGFATPLAYAAGFLAFLAQLRGVLVSARRTSLGDVGLFEVSEASMNTLSGGLVRLSYPFLLSGLLAFGLGSLQAVSLGWFWQKSVAAQLFVLVAYSIYLHLCVSRPTSRGRMLLAQFAAFFGIIVSVLSFDVPHGLLRGVGLDVFL
jgi:hypothetical protein